jgi:hypothetical protein
LPAVAWFVLAAAAGVFVFGGSRIVGTVVVVASVVAVPATPWGVVVVVDPAGFAGVVVPEPPFVVMFVVVELEIVLVLLETFVLVVNGTAVVVAAQ